MLTTSFTHSIRRNQHCDNLRSHLGWAASFVLNQLQKFNIRNHKTNLAQRTQFYFRGDRGDRDRSYLTRRSPSPPGASRAGFGSGPVQSAPATRLDSSNKGHQMLMKMGYSGTGGLGASESGISEPIHGGEVRDKVDQFRGVGNKVDEFEAFRKQRGQMHFSRMKGRDKEK